MKIGNMHVWNAHAEPTSPLCIGYDEDGDSGWSLTVWMDGDEPVGVLLHKYDNTRRFN